MRRSGAVYALPSTPAGLESFAADLLAVSPDDVDEGGDNCTLALPACGDAQGTSWTSVHLDLLAPGQIQAAPQQPPAGATGVNISLPPCCHAGTAAAVAKVSNDSPRYKQRRALLKRQPAERKRKAGAEGAGAGASAATPAEQPDGEALFLKKWLRMRDAAMSEL